MELPECGSVQLPYDPFSYARRASRSMRRQGVGVGGEETVRVALREKAFQAVADDTGSTGDLAPEICYETSGVLEIDPRDKIEIARLNAATEDHLVAVKDGIDLPTITAYRLLAARIEARHPILLKDTLGGKSEDENGSLEVLLTAATNIGSLLCDGIGDAVMVQGEQEAESALRLAYNVLQAAGSRIFKTDYVACPSCGRTLFDLQSTTARIKAATEHLKGVKIAIMGCIVNGPGEMADADFGYVGGAPGKVNLYVGKTPVKFNIPEAEAVDRLQDLIKEHGKWVDP